MELYSSWHSAAICVLKEECGDPIFRDGSKKRRECVQSIVQYDGDIRTNTVINKSGSYMLVMLLMCSISPSKKCREIENARMSLWRITHGERWVGILVEAGEAQAISWTRSDTTNLCHGSRSWNAALPAPLMEEHAMWGLADL